MSSRLSSKTSPFMPQARLSGQNMNAKEWAAWAARKHGSDVLHVTKQGEDKHIGASNNLFRTLRSLVPAWKRADNEATRQGLLEYHQQMSRVPGLMEDDDAREALENLRDLVGDPGTEAPTLYVDAVRGIFTTVAEAQDRVAMKNARDLLTGQPAALAALTTPIWSLEIKKTDELPGLGRADGDAAAQVNIKRHYDAARSKLDVHIASARQPSREHKVSANIRNHRLCAALELALKDSGSTEPEATEQGRAETAASVTRLFTQLDQLVDKAQRAPAEVLQALKDAEGDPWPMKMEAKEYLEGFKDNIETLRGAAAQLLKPDNFKHLADHRQIEVRACGQALAELVTHLLTDPFCQDVYKLCSVAEVNPEKASTLLPVAPSQPLSVSI